jgi:hypothetical protein
MTRRLTTSRRGNYALLLALSMFVLLGFGALAIDFGYMLMSRSQAQDVADAASQAALIVLRQSGDQDLAEEAAEQITAANRVAGESADLVEVEFGGWDDTLDVPHFNPAENIPNAVRVRVSREDDNRVPFLLSRIWGYEDFKVDASAISATRSVQVVIVLDITGSWGEWRFTSAREAVLLALDMFSASAALPDEVGLVIFNGRYGWEYTPLTKIRLGTNTEDVRDTWELLNMASRAGYNPNPYDGSDCWYLYNRRDFVTFPGGCYPAMPREYGFEAGTDHSSGVEMADVMFRESGADARYRAMIVVTDGRPNGTHPWAGYERMVDGHVETRWREYRNYAGRSTSGVRTATINATSTLWDQLNVHTWAVSLVADDPMMSSMVQGDGYYVRTNDPDELSVLLAQIISELPLAVVR